MAGTLTVSGVERLAVLQALEAQYRALPHGHPDCMVIHAVSTYLGQSNTVALTKLQAFVILRGLRAQHQRMGRDLMALEERRLRGGHNGHLDAAHIALDAESAVLADVLRRLWEMLGA